MKRKTIIKKGYGFCDQCGEERIPQEYVGYGAMICLDCIDENEKLIEKIVPGSTEENK